jgi:hypothetical protein
MNKKLLGLAMAGILSVTSLPAVTASAAETNTVTPSVKSSVKASNGLNYIYSGTELYSQPYSDCYDSTLTEDTRATSIAWYKDKWYKVKIHGDFYYVYGIGHFH